MQPADLELLDLDLPIDARLIATFPTASRPIPTVVG
jgi:hypothetical protein